jgi:hypothetical protein
VFQAVAQPDLRSWLGLRKINRKLQTPIYNQEILASSLDDNPARANAVGCEELRSRSEDNIVPNFEKFGVLAVEARTWPVNATTDFCAHSTEDSLNVKVSVWD